MEWYVYYYDINHGNIVTYNIFDHGSFKEDFNKLISDYNITKEEFANKLDIMLRYYFWSKAQWETFLKEIVRLKRRLMCMTKLNLTGTNS